MTDNKERTELRLPVELKMTLVSEARKMGMSLNDYCIMKLSNNFIAISNGLPELYAALGKHLENRPTINGIHSYIEGGTINPKK